MSTFDLNATHLYHASSISRNSGTMNKISELISGQIQAGSHDLNVPQDLHWSSHPNMLHDILCASEKLRKAVVALAGYSVAGQII